jgi:hypothetical protein
MQHQNFAERHWQDLKRLTTWLMAYKNVPKDLWLLCLEYVADIMNITTVQSLNLQTPLQPLTGQTPNSSIAMVFEFYDDVYYCRDLKPVFPFQTVEKKGRFIGFSKDVGHALTYKILTEDTRKILHWSIVHQTDLQPNRHLDPDAALPILPELALLLCSNYKDALREEGSYAMPTFPALDPDDLFKMQDGEQDHGEQ